MRDFLAGLSAHQTALEAVRAHERYRASGLVRAMQQNAFEAVRACEPYSFSSPAREMQQGTFGTVDLSELAAQSLSSSALEGLIASARLVADLDFLGKIIGSVDLAGRIASSAMPHLRIYQDDPLSRITAALGTASLMQGIDPGVFRQSVAAAAILQAARNEAFAYDQIMGRSFAFDALAEMESFQQRLDQEGDVENLLTALLEAILNRFARYIATARTGFERDSLTQMLFLLMAAATLMGDVKTLMVSIESRNIAIESLEVARSEADESARDLGTIRDALNGQRSAQEEHTAKILVLLQQIRDALDERNMAADGAPRYIVKRQVELKTEQRMRSDTIAILFPNQVVRLITRRGKWIEVEYYDHLAGRTHSGWVVKKHLRVLR